MTEAARPDTEIESCQFRKGTDQVEVKVRNFFVLFGPMYKFSIVHIIIAKLVQSSSKIRFCERCYTICGCRCRGQNISRGRYIVDMRPAETFFEIWSLSGIPRRYWKVFGRPGVFICLVVARHACWSILWSDRIPVRMPIRECQGREILWTQTFACSIYRALSLMAITLSIIEYSLYKRRCGCKLTKARFTGTRSNVSAPCWSMNLQSTFIEASQPMYVYCVCPHMLSLFETWNASKPICRAWLIVSNDDSCVRWNHFILSHRPPPSDDSQHHLERLLLRHLRFSSRVRRTACQGQQLLPPTSHQFRLRCIGQWRARVCVCGGGVYVGVGRMRNRNKCGTSVSPHEDLVWVFV